MKKKTTREELKGTRTKAAAIVDLKLSLEQTFLKLKLEKILYIINSLY